MAEITFCRVVFPVELTVSGYRYPKTPVLRTLLEVQNPVSPSWKGVSGV